jgi:hypothetical protein
MRKKAYRVTCLCLWTSLPKYSIPCGGFAQHITAQHSTATLLLFSSSQTKNSATIEDFQGRRLLSRPIVGIVIVIVVGHAPQVPPGLVLVDEGRGLAGIHAELGRGVSGKHQGGIKGIHPLSSSPLGSTTGVFHRGFDFLAHVPQNILV